jgi:hypothetical protein
MLVVNLSYTSKDFLKLKESLSSNKYTLLDITNSLDETDGILRANNLDTDFKLLKDATNDMIDAIGDVSLLFINRKEQIRDIELNGLNIYWQTSISEKHPARNFLINLFYFKKILEQKLLYLKVKKVYIILPSLYEAVYNISIKKYVVNKHSIEEVEFNYQFDKTYLAGHRSIIYKLRNNFIESTGLKKILKPIDKTDTSKTYYNYIVTPVPGTWQEVSGEDRVLGKIAAYSGESTSTYLPYILSYDSNFKWAKEWDTNYLNYYPSKLQLCLHQIKAFFLLKNVQIFNSVNFAHIDFIDANVLRYQFQKVIFDQNYVFINYLWMRNFFSSIKKEANIFYQDEFYPTGGRFISQAVNRSKNEYIASCGVQHGIIYKGHSVYQLTGKELNCTKEFNGLPKPNRFIVWGNYFKKIINENRNFNEQELLVAGNLNYIDIAKKYNKLKTKNEIPVVLWCTSVEYLTVAQYKIIEEFLKSLPDYKLVIRFHPLHNLEKFILKIMDETVLNKTVFKNDNDIFDAIYKADIVLAITASTIFMDALALNKIVYQFKVPNYFNESLPTNNAILIESSDELSNAYKNYMLQDNSSVLSKQNLLHIDDSVWRKLLNLKSTRNKTN